MTKSWKVCFRRTIARSNESTKNVASGNESDENGCPGKKGLVDVDGNVDVRPAGGSVG